MLNLADAVAAFAATMRAAGMTIAEQPVADGRLHRVHVEGDRNGRKNGWYVLHAAPFPAGAYGHWASGLSEKWCAKPDHQQSAAERAALHAFFAQARATADRTRQRKQSEAANRAVSLYAKFPDASDNTPYLSRKGVRAIAGLKVRAGVLVVPVTDVDGNLHSLQFIAPTGDKRFLRDGRKRGLFFCIGAGQMAGASLFAVCEGLATGASIHEATGWPVFVAFDAGNLLPVAEQLRARRRSANIVLCGDNDAFTPGNPGATAARNAAARVSGCAVLPSFANREGRPTDFNDLHQREGLAIVRAQLLEATK